MTRDVPAKPNHVNDSPSKDNSAKSNWRLLITGKGQGAWNMAVDEAIMESVAAGTVRKTIRLYGWEPACVSVGMFQSLEREVDLDRCRELGVDYVRRPTGGRVVLHEMELTYSLVAPQDDPFVSGSIKESYRKISEAIRTGVQLLGVTTSAERMVSANAAQKRSGACFDSRSDYELSYEGKKLVGSAQCRRNGVVLQHGSILLDLDASRLFSLLRIHAGLDIAKETEAFSRRVSTMKDAVGRPVSFDELTEATIRGFELVIGTRLQQESLSDEECRLADRLRCDKYINREWSFCR